MSGVARISRSRGSALLLVLWLSLLLATILLAVAVLVQAQVRAARSEVDDTRTREILRSALDVAAFDTALIGRTALSEFPRTISVAGQRVTVDLSPSQDMLDINLANDEDWIALWVRLGEPEAEARRLADLILDWRDPDDQPRAFGFEGGDGERRTMNRAFSSVEELSRVTGVTPRRLACVRPFVTALGGTRLPEFDDLQGAQALTMDGMRTAFRARMAGPGGRTESMTGLALFAAEQDRPFEWVSFGVDRPYSDACGQAPTTALDTQPDAWH
jgi:general secretion pathway protein K